MKFSFRLLSNFNNISIMKIKGVSYNFSKADI